MAGSGETVFGKMTTDGVAVATDGAAVTLDGARSGRERWSVAVACGLFVVCGLNAGVTGVLLPAQIADYGVDQATIGTVFFTNSAGFVAASTLTGPLVGRLGVRRGVLASGAVMVASWLAVSARPPLVVFILLGFATGYGMGLLECLLNVRLATKPGSTALLNRLHAYFGVGALLGPPLAAWLLTFTDWTTAMLMLAVITVPLLAASSVSYPTSAADPLRAPPTPVARPASAGLSTTVRRPAVALATVMLAVYVGLEIGVGNWGYTYLVEERSVSDLLAGYTSSGYWLGLTAGRFLATPVTARLRLTQTGLMNACMAGTMAAAALAWVAPGTAGLASAAFVLLGFFLGPIFPTMMAVAPRLTSEGGLVATVIGVLSAGGLVGGALLPWLAGALLQVAGAWTLFPFALLLACAQLALWWRVVRRLAG